MTQSSKKSKPAPIQLRGGPAFILNAGEIGILTKEKFIRVDSDSAEEIKNPGVARVAAMGLWDCVCLVLTDTDRSSTVLGHLSFESLVNGVLERADPLIDSKYPIARLIHTEHANSVTINRAREFAERHFQGWGLRQHLVIPYAPASIGFYLDGTAFEPYRLETFPDFI